MPAISAKDDTSTLVPHLCAVVDQAGEALHIVCGFDNSVQMEYAFARFVDNEIRLADKGVYVPDYSLQHYCFATNTSFKEIRQRADEPGALPAFVRNNGGRKVCDLPLQVASYAYSNRNAFPRGLGPDDFRALSDPEMSEPLKREVKQYMERLAAFRRQVGTQERFVTVLATARGSVVFDDSGYGQLFLEKFLQHLADRFFDPACRDLKRVRETLITNPGSELLAQATADSRMYSRLDLRLVPERIAYHPNLVIAGQKEGTSSIHRLGTDMADLRQLVADYRLHMSERNLYIQALLRVRDQGFAPGFIASSLLAQQLFSRELDACRQQGSPPEASSAASRKAARELKERFGIETPEIRTKQTRNPNKKKDINYKTLSTMNDTALQQDTQSDIPCHKSLFATLDERGTPVRLRPCIDWGRKPQIDQAFGNYVREDVHINNIRAAVPDYRLCRYDFDDDAPLHRFSWNDPDANLLARFVEENGGKLTEQYSLIAAMTVFLCFSDVPDHPEMDILRRAYDPRQPEAELHERIEQCVHTHREQLQQNPIHQRGVIVDTTPRGSVVLEHTGYGNRCHRGYLQYLADHYFDPQHKDITSLEMWVIRGCTPQLHAQGVESRRMFNRGDFSLIPERIAYRQCALEGEPPAQEMHRLPLGHNTTDFRNFINRYDLSISDRNIDIYTLLGIVEGSPVQSDRKEASRMLQKKFGVEISIPEPKKQHKPSLH